MPDPFLVNPQSLQQLDQLSVRNHLGGLDWQRNAENIDQFTMADMPRARQAAQAREAADLAGVLSQNKYRDTQTTGLGIQNEGAQRDLDVRKAIPITEEVRAKLSAMARDMSDADLKTTTNRAAKMAMSDDLEEAAMGAKILAATQEMLKIKEQQAGQMALAQENNAAAIYRQQLASRGTVEAAGVRSAKTGVRNDFESRLTKAGGDSKKMVSVYEDEIARLRSTGAPEDAQAANALEQRMIPVKEKYEREQQDATNKSGWYRNEAGKLELWRSGKLVKGATPPPAATKPVNQNPDAKAPTNAPPGKMRMRNAQGQEGYVPIEQAVEAMKQGYVEVK